MRTLSSIASSALLRQSRLVASDTRATGSQYLSGFIELTGQSRPPWRTSSSACSAPTLLPNTHSCEQVASMDVVQAVSGYITKMVSGGDNASIVGSPAKMKILLLDSETVRVLIMHPEDAC